MFTLIRDRWGTHIEAIHQFLMTVQPNLIWHCYLNSVDRALSDRHFNSDDPPAFTQFQPGYSGLAMFVVDRANETRQIAKLTTRKKLRTEWQKYSDYVRYKIPLAARIPENGVAFDTKGTLENLEGGDNEGYGVIVSDLIAGDTWKDQKTPRTPKSFLSLCCELMADKTERFCDVSDAIEYHFGQNVRIWNDEGKSRWEETPEAKLEECAELIERLTRTGRHEGRLGIIKRLEKISSKIGEDEGFATSIVEMLKSATAYAQAFVLTEESGGICKELNNASDLDALIATLSQKLQGSPEDMGSFPPKLKKPHSFRPAFVHGDLNGNNLTWASHYNRFVMIDFENIDLGFSGFDQLKLMASMICETVPSARDEAEGASAVSEREHDSTIRLIRFVQWLLLKLLAADNIPDSLESMKKQADELEEPIVSLAVQIVATIGLQNLSLDTPETRLFWRMIVRNLFFRQFEFAFRDLDSRHLVSVDKVVDAVGDKSAGTEEVYDGDLFATAPNVFDTPVDGNVLMLFYAYVALLTTLR